MEAPLKIALQLSHQQLSSIESTPEHRNNYYEDITGGRGLYMNRDPSQFMDSGSYRMSRLNEIKETLMLKGKVTEENYSSLKYVMKEVFGYREYSSSIRNEIISYLSCQTYNINQVIIAPDQVADMFVVIEGSVQLSSCGPEDNDLEEEKQKFDILRQFEVFKMISPGETFGNMTCFQYDKHWKSYYAYAISPQTVVLRLDFTKSKALLEKISMQQKHIELIQFLNDSLPGFKVRTTAVKERISKLFSGQRFNPGHKFITEGEKSEYAYIVKKGEVKMVSGQIPMIISNLEKIKRSGGQQRLVVNNSGLFSQTLNSFQIGVISPKQWTGDEIIVLRDDPFPYSVVASTIVEVLAISKQDLLLKIPKDIRELMEGRVQIKQEWIKKRLIDICLGVETISLWDNLQQDFMDKVSQCNKKFPITSTGAFLKILNQTAASKVELNSVVSGTLQETNKGTINLFEADYTVEKHMKRRAASQVYIGGMFGGQVDFTDQIKLQNSNQRTDGSPNLAVRFKRKLLQRPCSSSCQSLMMAKTKIMNQDRPQTAQSTQFQSSSLTQRSLPQSTFVKIPLLLEQFKAIGPPLQFHKQNKKQAYTDRRIPLDFASTFRHSVYSKQMIPTIDKNILQERKTQLLLALKEKSKSRQKHASTFIDSDVQRLVNTTHRQFDLCGRKITALDWKDREGTVNPMGDVTPRELVLSPQMINNTTTRKQDPKSENSASTQRYGIQQREKQIKHNPLPRKISTSFRKIQGLEH